MRELILKNMQEMLRARCIYLAEQFVAECVANVSLIKANETELQLMLTETKNYMNDKEKDDF